MLQASIPLLRMSLLAILSAVLALRLIFLGFVSAAVLIRRHTLFRQSLMSAGISSQNEFCAQQSTRSKELGGCLSLDMQEPVFGSQRSSVHSLPVLVQLTGVLVHV